MGPWLSKCRLIEVAYVMHLRNVVPQHRRREHALRPC
uniref:Uncharacterized protein n=1 Tax=Arundo donax TaxID=35708 RepID=A0A0A8YX24_ARUDO